MHKKNLRYFFLTLIMALLIILPTVALIGAYSITRVRTVAEPVENVPITKPTEEDDRNILLVTTGENNSFMLLKFDAFGRSVVSLALPENMLVNETDTADSLLEKGGPAMVTTELERLFDLTIDYYSMLTHQELLLLTQNFVPASLTEDIADRLSLPEDYEVTPLTAVQLIEQAEEKDVQLVRSICYSLLLEANMEIMQAEIPAAFKDISATINSNIAAEELYRLAKIFSLLPYEKVNYYAATLSGEQADNGIAISESDIEKAVGLLD